MTTSFVPTDLTGKVFRCIPHGATKPLDSSFSLRGQRWNPPHTFQVLYTFVGIGLARNWAQRELARLGATPDNAQPEILPDLAVIDCNLSGLADLTHSAGLTSVGLPTTYPIGFETPSAWMVTQPIGAALHAQGTPGVLTRSAIAKAWDGDQSDWAELAIFPDNAKVQPVLVERLPYSTWV